MAGWARGRDVAVAGGLTAALTACGTAGASPLVHRGDVVPVQAGTLTARDAAEAQTRFGLDLLHAVCGPAPEDDVLLSPASAAVALGLLYPASGGRTAEELGALLHLPPWSPDLVAALRDHGRTLDRLRYDGDLDDEDAPDSLQTSNRLWTATSVEPDQGYLDDIATPSTPTCGCSTSPAIRVGPPTGSTRRSRRTPAGSSRSSSPTRSTRTPSLC